MKAESPKLQKVMAQAGYGSRRACERMIRAGLVRVNGERASLGVRVDPNLDEILIDGRPMRNPEPLTYIMLHKPNGVLSSATSQGGWPTVLDLVQTDQRVYPVGRLDLESEGLVLLTNDGVLAHTLTHPAFGHEKEYRVLLNKIPTKDQLRSWSDGVSIPEFGSTMPAKVQLEEPMGSWLRVVLKQGMKRQIRETARVLGLTVERLIRVRIASLELGSLGAGDWRLLEQSEIDELRMMNHEPVEAG